MQWLEITVNTHHDKLEGLTNSLEDLGVEGLITEDETEVADFLENNKKYWDYVDEGFAASIKGVCRVKFYFEDSDDGRRELGRISAALPDYEFISAVVKDEDWENNWKEYYKPIPVGERLIIVPEWEDAPESNGKTVLRLDPGLIFGTGAHATTQMCLESLQEYDLSGKNVLDLGCGSGILAIAALLLGAESAVGCDIDEKAPAVVMENAALNGISGDKLSVFAGDVLSDSNFSRKLSGGKFNIVLANIVADVIIALAPKIKDFLSPGGVFICSGIIDGRENEVAQALMANGFKAARRQKDNWNAFICTMEEK
ncbi:MAG: 50S ribosomal protein L11 methyltransferase [Oscillospiraceae bacterium]